MVDELPNIIELEVINWDKHQPKRNDVKSPTWFKLKHDIFDDSVIYNLTNSEFKIWIYILTLCSKHSQSIIRLSTDHARTMCRARTDHIHSCIFKLEQYQMVRVVSRNVHVTLDKKRREEIRIDEISEKPVGDVVKITSLNKDLPKTFEQVITRIPKSTKDRWKNLYPDIEFLDYEGRRAFGHYADLNKLPESIYHWCNALSFWYDKHWKLRKKEDHVHFSI